MIETMTGVPVIGEIPHMTSVSDSDIVWREEWWQ